MLTINKPRFESGDLLDHLRLAFYLNPTSVKLAFYKKGVLVEDDEDLKALATLSNSKGDINGKLKGADGKPIYFEVFGTLKTVVVENESASKLMEQVTFEEK